MLWTPCPFNDGLLLRMECTVYFGVASAGVWKSYCYRNIINEEEGELLEPYRNTARPSLPIFRELVGFRPHEDDQLLLAACLLEIGDRHQAVTKSAAGIRGPMVNPSYAAAYHHDNVAAPSVSQLLAVRIARARVALAVACQWAARCVGYPLIRRLVARKAARSAVARSIGGRIAGMLLSQETSHV